MIANLKSTYRGAKKSKDFISKEALLLCLQTEAINPKEKIVKAKKETSK